MYEIEGGLVNKGLYLPKSCHHVNWYEHFQVLRFLVVFFSFFFFTYFYYFFFFFVLFYNVHAVQSGKMKITSAENNSSPIRFQLYFHVHVAAIGLSFFEAHCLSTRNSWSVWWFEKFFVFLSSVYFFIFFFWWLKLANILVLGLHSMLLQKICSYIPRRQYIRYKCIRIYLYIGL